MTSPPPEVRPPRPDEAAICRAWLPDAFPALGWPAELLVAVAPTGPVAAGAVAWVPAGFRILLHVEPAWRRQGIGTRLLAAMIGSAKGETTHLRTWSHLPEDGPAVAFLRASGFASTQRLLVFETDAVQFGQSMTALLRRLSPRVPSTYCLRCLAEASSSAVLADLTPLLATEFSNLPDHVAFLLAAGPPYGYDRDLSLVLLDEDRPAGAMLCRREAGHLLIDVNLVAPHLRRSPANLMLLEAMARRARAAGIGAFRFSCEPGNRDTIGLARRSGATALPPTLSLSLPLAGR